MAFLFVFGNLYVFWTFPFLYLAMLGVAGRLSRESRVVGAITERRFLAGRLRHRGSSWIAARNQRAAGEFGGCGGSV
jgi:hypothetical protein